MRILSALVWAATALVIASTNPVLAQSASALGRDELLMMCWEFSGGKGCPPTNLDAAAQVCNQRQDKNSRPDANIDHRCAEVRAKLAQRHRLQDETENAADRAVIERGLREPNGKPPPLEYQDPNRRPAKKFRSRSFANSGAGHRMLVWPCLTAQFGARFTDKQLRIINLFLIVKCDVTHNPCGSGDGDTKLPRSGHIVVSGRQTGSSI